MPQPYIRIPSVEESTDTPLSLAISVESPTPPTDHHSITIQTPFIKISPTKTPASPCDYDYLSDEEGCMSPFGIQHEQPKFIKMVGAPKPSSSGEEPLELDPLTGAPIKPTPSSVVNAVDHENVLVDVLEAQNEDPFTLEPFDSLIQMHMEKDKDFIIARVTTVDPNDETRFYYSYYAAHHINKVLFRTQPEEGLLHRMKAKNPLNNMTIVGDVHYFVVSAAAMRAQNNAITPGRSSFDSIRSVNSIRSISSIRSVNSIRSMMSVFSTASVSSTGSGRREFDRFRRRPPRAKSTSVSVHESDGGKAGLGRFLGIGQHGVRKRTLHLIMRPDAFENVVEEVVPLTEEEGGKGKGINGKGVFVRGKIRPLSAESGRKVKEDPPEGRRSRRNSMDDAFAEGDGIKMGTRVSSSRQEDDRSSEGRSSLDGGAHAGTANYRVGSTTPKIHRRVRSISFSNEHHGVLNLQDWIKMHSEDDKVSPSGPVNGRESNNGASSNKTAIQRLRSTNGHTSHTAPSSSRRQHSPPPRQQRRTRTPLLEQALSPTSPSIPEPFYFVAKFYATDDDFLMKAAVRAYFKENALDTSDAVLFTIPSSRDENEVLEGTEDHPALMGFVYAVSEEDEEGGWLGRSSGGSRGLKWILLCYVAFGFLLIKFVVPDAYAYIMAFLLIFLLCLVMILCL
ncbi:uncharacterized protein SPPG_01209 [Spizellomyces punctatus DAOM BR117]|uniref:Uncharacterized protein n=1 Tax=Spizellomyces punctatus (strain DAOM BR117) TaxID=645134 RepID=A0A0L0HSC8_SPIPD|nr:uncharacterized protein SPPG_01209 [Spizellomyces punctatus DAOM BR117]KND03754.1 hypothetical protein SPPG_01209 [Spizellomyces punctatus DAOM BR117]|eukprot:XP_016611793.1 hypothetical protein SPPG_01209 [Spizellomyces punctatus DAOM BR117]